jgi:hypothetical protein
MNPLIPFIAIGLIALTFVLTRNIGITVIAAFPLVGAAGILVGLFTGAFTIADLFSWKIIALVCGVAMFFALATGRVSSRDSVFTNIQDVLNIGRQLEPERENHGVVIYKWLMVDGWKLKSAFGGRAVEWRNMRLDAHELPTMQNTSGIYGFFSPNDPHLKGYELPGSIKVKIECHGQKVLHTFGARVQHATITEILDATRGITLADGTDLRDYYKQKGMI